MRAPNLNLVVGTVAIVATGAILYMVFKKGASLGAAAKTLIDAVNPANPDNVVAKAADAVVQAASGGKYLSIGDYLYNKFGNDTAGAAAIAPSQLNRVKKADYFATVDAEDARPNAQVVQISDYWASIEADDQAAGARAREAIASDDPAYNSSEGGAPFGNPLIMRQGVRYGATRE